jgi:four helix bundle protein
LPIADCRLGLQLCVSTPTELKTRTKAFALRIIKMSRDISKNEEAGRVIAKQILRSGTSVAVNYRASCRARSQAEFIAKIGTVEEEPDELTAIMAFSHKTAAGK